MTWSTLKYKIPGSRDFCLFCSLLHPWHSTEPAALQTCNKLLRSRYFLLTSSSLMVSTPSKLQPHTPPYGVLPVPLGWNTPPLAPPRAASDVTSLYKVFLIHLTIALTPPIFSVLFIFTPWKVKPWRTACLAFT